MTAKIDSTSLYGTLNLLVLQAVSDGPLHGLAIARAIQGRTDEVLQIEEGRSTQRYTGCSETGWSWLSGAPRRTIAGPSSIV